MAIIATVTMMMVLAMALMTTMVALIKAAPPCTGAAVGLTARLPYPRDRARLEVLVKPALDAPAVRYRHAPRLVLR
jgi:ABC-type phosphate transport system permease subunit